MLTERVIVDGFVAELHSVDLACRPWSDAALKEIERAMKRYGVLILPGQNLDDDRLLAFAEYFGPVAKGGGNPTRKKTAPPGVAEISNLGPDGELVPPDDSTQQFSRANEMWHSDLSFTRHGAAHSMLHAREVPATGGETEFADTARAYAALPPEIKEQIETLEALHSLRFSRAKGELYSEQNNGSAKEDIFAHPLVQRHPATGHKSLYIGSHAGQICGMEAAAGTALLDELLDHATKPERVYSHHWTVDDLLIWDNRRVLHRRGADFDPTQRRSMRRVTNIGALDGELVKASG